MTSPRGSEPRLDGDLGATPSSANVGGSNVERRGAAWRVVAIGLVACLVGCGSTGKSRDDAAAFDGPGEADAPADTAGPVDVDESVDADADASPDATVDASDAPATADASDGSDGDTEVDVADAGADTDDAATLDADDAASAGDAAVDGQRTINVTAARTQLIHTVNGHTAGLDNRAPRMLGKLIVSMGVTSGSYLPYAGKRGFHVLGVGSASCQFIQNWTHGTAYPGDCRANSFDGLPHGDQSTVTVGTSIAAQVKSSLSMLKTMFPAEDWGYFLDDDGSVRWSDVVLSGYDYGSTNAARIGALVGVDRVVMDTGFQDNSCGTGASPTWPADGGVSPSGYYDASCVKFADWLGETPATPLDRFFVFVGRQDAIFGDVMFAADHFYVAGPPHDIDITSPPYDGTHVLVHESGHLSLVGASTTTLDRIKALDYAFGVPFANQNPQF
jgi:hypothetical protein